MAIVLSNLLKQLTHNEMTCVAGQTGLNAIIENVTVIDSPEILNWIRGGELVVSTGYVSYNNAGMLNELVAGLKEKGAVGLGIKVNRFYQEVPEILITEGNRLGFPVFAISYEMRISDIMKLVYANFFTDSMTKTEKENLLYQQVTKAILSGENLDAAVFNISLAFKNPVVLMDENMGLLSFENHEDNQVPIEKYLNLSETEGVLPVAEGNNLLDYYRETQFRLHKMTIHNGEDFITATFCPIQINQELKGFLAVLETVSEVDKDFYSILENSTNILAIYLLQKSLQNDNRNYSKESFLTNVLMKLNNTDKLIQYYCDVWNFDFVKKRVCIFFKINHFQSMTFYKRREITETFKRSARKAVSDNKCLDYQISFQDGFILYHFYGEDDQDRMIAENTKAAAEEIVNSLEKNGITVHACISAIGKSLQHIPESFREVIEGIRMGESIFPEKEIYDYGEMMIYDFLGNAISLDKLLSLYNNTIAELDWYDRANNTEFLNTLEVYLENNCNISKAAQMLHLHRNTMMYRVEKIEDILQIDLKEAEVTFRLRLGVRAKKILKLYHK